jgi:hypothetical protein
MLRFELCDFPKGHLPALKRECGLQRIVAALPFKGQMLLSRKTASRGTAGAKRASRPAKPHSQLAAARDASQR